MVLVDPEIMILLPSLPHIPPSPLTFASTGDQGRLNGTEAAVPRE